MEKVYNKNICYIKYMLFNILINMCNNMLHNMYVGIYQMDGIYHVIWKIPYVLQDIAQEKKLDGSRCYREKNYRYGRGQWGMKPKQADRNGGARLIRKL